jgi:anti-anti-sigma regulatory factor
MASNFKILVNQNSENLHLKLVGDFDGSSAHELIETIKDHRQCVQNVFIHTNGLRDIHPFGKGVFQKTFQKVCKTGPSFVFTGENGNRLAPSN